MSEMEELIAAQRELHRRIARTCENIKKLGAAKISVEVIRTSIPLLDQKWQKFEDNHSTLMRRFRAELMKHDYVASDLLSIVEMCYTEQRSYLLQEERRLTPQAQATFVTAENSKKVEPAHRAKLPRIEIPKFNGHFEEWPSFRDMFTSLIREDESLSKVERLHYLKTSVRGDAESLIRDLPSTGDSYDRAWDTLKQHYENKRLLVRSYLAAFNSLPKMRAGSAADLRRIFHGMLSAVGSLEGIGRPISSSEDLFVHLVVERLDLSTRREWENLLGKTSEPPAYEVLRGFLQEQLQTQEALQDVSKGSGGVTKPATRTSHNAGTAKDRASAGEPRRCCPICKGLHFLAACDKYARKSSQERLDFVRSLGRCTNCLGKHDLTACNSGKTCFKCAGRHHTSLHDALAPALRADAPAFPGPSVLAAEQAPSECASVLLATARVFVVDSSGKEHAARALLDSGSETSLVSESLAQRLRLARTPSSVAIFGIGGHQSGHARGRVSLQIRSRNRQFAAVVSSLVLPRLSSYSGAASRGAHAWPHLRNLELADPDFEAKDPVEILLGADAYAELVVDGLRRGGPQEPVAQNTKLGWIILGAAGGEAPITTLTALQCSCADDLPDALRRFWEWEEPEPTALPLTEAEEECERLFAQTCERLPSGRYRVRLPLRPNAPDLSLTRRAAERMCNVMDRRFERDVDLQNEYCAFMTEYEQLGHMTQVEPFDKAQNSRVCYLPHHGVKKATEPNGKLRVVFNGSSAVHSGASLNSALLTGPNLLPALPDVLLRWRQHRYAFVADIEKMYRQIIVHPEDRDLQRVLWRAEKDGARREFQLNTVTYGLACAPFLAIRVTRQLADDESELHPAGAAALRNDTYVDDVLSGADTLEEAVELRKDLTAVCMAGGFHLRKWAANCASIISEVPEDDRAMSSSSPELPFIQHSVLGLRWNPERDDLSLVVRVAIAPGTTKRELVSATARLFDPLGWLAPVVVRAKLLIQTTWLQQLGWDSPLADEEARAWRCIQEDLPKLEEVRVPRWLQGAYPSSAVQVHGFADASERAFAAVVYLRYSEGGRHTVSLALAKTKVAPLKRISLPRLELCAASLLAKLVTRVTSALGLSSTRAFCWSDSTVTLAWIQGHPTRWTTFVANRVAEIHREVPSAQWRHIPGKDNPADCASRGLFPAELREHALWWQGPRFLQEEEAYWPPIRCGENEEELPEARPPRCMAAQVPVREPEELRRFSSFSRLLRVTSWMRRWVKKRTSRGPLSQQQGLEAAELDQALQLWVRIVQGLAFRNEIRDVQAGRSVAPGSALRALTPFLDEKGILRVGGRLKFSILSSEQRHPIILPPDSHLTLLIIRSNHQRTYHGGVQATLAAIRQRFWVPRGRQAVKRVLRQCTTCARWRAATPQPKMGSLPADRVTPHRPFLHAGVDFAGPYPIRTSKGRGQKASKGFLAIFVCFSTRAVHLEAVSDYSSATFLSAFRRFVARRGLCETVYSDCGTNFVGADTELKALFAQSSSTAQAIKDNLSLSGIQWRFNPPSAPHFGGLWEAAVKSVKYHLRRVIGEHTLTFEEMSTLLAEIEACLNSRPLQALSDDPDDLEALTPGHFLIGGPMNAIPEPSLTNVPPARLTRWRLLQQMREHFWHRWVQEHLQALTPVPKWWRTSGGLRDGQLCLVKSETLPPTKWPLARVVRRIPGKDGEVRVVDVRTTKGMLTRPVVKIVPLPQAEQ